MCSKYPVLTAPWTLVCRQYWYLLVLVIVFFYVFIDFFYLFIYLTLYSIMNSVIQYLLFNGRYWNWPLNSICSFSKFTIFTYSFSSYREDIVIVRIFDLIVSTGFFRLKVYRESAKWFLQIWPPCVVDPLSLKNQNIASRSN